MIPTMIVVGLIGGRWWRPTVILGALLWPAMLVANDVMNVESGLLTAAALGALNAGVGILIHQALLRLVRLSLRAMTR